MDRRGGGAPRPRPLDHGDPRTPMAWQHRNMNYQQQYQVYSDRGGPVSVAELPPEQYAYHEEMSRGPSRSQHFRSRSHTQGRPTSPSTETSATSSSSAEPDTDSQIQEARPIHAPPPPLGTLRSVQSTLTTWDGEPCPVHHMAMSLPMLLPPPPPPPPPRYPMMAMTAPPPPALLLPPMLRPRPLVMSAENPSPLEPLPVRDPKVSLSPLPPKDSGSQSKSIHCCKGHIVVLWIILGIILTGVLLGVILRFVIN